MNKKTRLTALLILAFGLTLLSIIAPYICPHDPLKTDFMHILEGPSWTYPLGTDQLGRCMLSRLMCGARVSLGMTSVLLVMVFAIGVLLGILAGIYRRVLDPIIMRVSDMFLAFPDMVFAIAVVGILGTGMINTVLALSVIWWTKYARLTRVLIIAENEKEYVSAAVMAGANKFRIVTHYILPNISGVLVVQLAVDVGVLMLALAGLSFLGLGIQPPTPEWGNMLSDGRPYMQTAPWLLIYPGLAILFVVTVFNVLGDALRDTLDPKFR